MTGEEVGVGGIAPEPVGLITDRVSDIEAQEIVWLWQGRIAQGKTSLVAGDPGLGKSLLTLYIAAITSRGGTWAVDHTEAVSGSVLIVSAEDDAADTIRPRLEAAGADLTRIRVLRCVRERTREGEVRERGLSLERDIEQMKLCIAEMGDCRLIVIDPISAYLGGIDSHKNADVRSIMAPLTKLAQDMGVAIVLVSHLNKGTGTSAAYRITGSIAFSGAVRSTMFVAKDKDDATRRLILPGKNNLAPDDPPAIAYRVAQNAAGRPYIEFEPDPVIVSADEALDRDDESEKKHDLDEAMDFLRDYLKNGPRPAAETSKAGRAAQISERTLKRAKAKVPVYSGKREFSGEWYWSLSPLKPDPNSAKGASRPSSETMAPFDDLAPFVEQSAKSANGNKSGPLRDPVSEECQMSEEGQGIRTGTPGTLGPDRPEVSI